MHLTAMLSRAASKLAPVISTTSFSCKFASTNHLFPPSSHFHPFFPFPSNFSTTSHCLLPFSTPFSSAFGNHNSPANPASPAIGKEEATASQMIKYARSLKNDEASYAEAVRVLEQGVSYFSGDGLLSVNAAGRVKLALATIHANRSNFETAAECLQHLVNSTTASLEIKAAALEALIGLYLQMHENDAALKHANSFLKLLNTNDCVEQLQSLQCRAGASKRLVDLACVSSCSESEASPTSSMPSNLENASGAVLLAHAEYFHVQGSLPLAKDLYEKSIQLCKKQLEENIEDLSAIAMVPEIVQIGALAGLGQLLTIMGNYEGAELQLTQALKHTERVKGEQHPQVGMVLSCVGDLYHQRTTTDGSSDALLTEAVYKSALDLMKAPPVDEDIEKHVELKEVMALVRARLAVTLAPAFHRRSEAEKLKRWVESSWTISRPLPELALLTELLAKQNTNPFEKKTGHKVPQKNLKGKTMLIDVRFGRVF